MIKRFGFVGNSSSSSFCLLGIKISLYDYDLDSLTEEQYEPNAFIEAIGDQDRNLEVLKGYESDTIYIGYSPCLIGEEETLSLFRQRTHDAINSFVCLWEKEAPYLRISESPKNLRWYWGEIYD